MKGFIKNALAVVLITTTMLSLAGCGEKNKESGVYVVVTENGNDVLHKVKYGELSFGALDERTTCCNKKITTNNYVMYGKDKPEAYAYDFECGAEN